jgi:NAD+ synthase (glutamine-hydrolysing)
MKIALAQINPTVGDLEGNSKKIIEYIDKARKQGADLIVFPELAITGYPPEDLVLKPQFITDNLAALDTIVKSSKGIGVYVGFVDRGGPKTKQILKQVQDDGSGRRNSTGSGQGKDLYNAGAFIADGKIVKTYYKNNLPNYAVFDEKRYFKEGDKPVVVTFKGVKIGLGICEDIWVENGPYKAEAKAKAKIIININASPYHMGKIGEREKVLGVRAKATKAHVVYVNMVGGQDELVFDGGSMIVNSKGKVIARAPMFKEALIITDEKGPSTVRHSSPLGASGEIAPKLDDIEEVYEALTTGIRDYVVKNKFKEVIIGLSGGIDSAITAAIAADALGKDKVHTIYMPSQYSAQQSMDDSKLLAKNLGIQLNVIPITEIFDMFLSDVNKYFRGKPEDVTEENMQARIRAVILMAMSNKFGWLLLTTGNKSETSTGYCTLYGDMAGGFNALKDVPKTLVYKLANWRNKSGEVIPKSIIDRAPTAELRPDQKDQDSLPPYDVLDRIIEAYVVENKNAAQIVKMGIDKDTVSKVISLIDKAEYKRRQSAPGPRITQRAFGKDWRLPITNGYR